MASEKGRIASQEEGAPDSFNDPPPPYRPTLPPRASDHLSPDAAPERQLFHHQSTTLSWQDQDPRNASTESLVPLYSPGGKRTLLLVYIHGFMGDETSFQSFPAHVHNVVTGLLQDTHVVHTKIYPQYRSRRAIQYARDDFSNWLAPHEGPKVDTILCGHSMGGLLSAEVALMPDPNPQASNALMHRLVGTINYDVPFLGMHPGVISSGLGSLFRPTPKSPDATKPNPMEQSQEDAGVSALSPVSTQDGRTQSLQTTTSMQSTGTLSLPTDDPNYDPPFVNDVRHPTRTGWDSAFHFITKHSDHLARATKSYVTSHLEFGGAMADYKGLNTRYKALRALADPSRQHQTVAGSSQSRGFVRFVNYYTASTGVPKPEKPQKQTQANTPEGISAEPSRIQPEESSTSNPPNTASTHPEKSNEEPITLKEPSNLHSSSIDSRAESSDEGEMTTLDPVPHEENPTGSVEPEPIKASTTLDQNGDREGVLEQENTTSPVASKEHPALPALPELPERPADFDPAQFTDKDSRKVAEKDYERAMKAYNRALKDREKAVKERSKILDKREKAAQKEADKRTKEAKKDLKNQAKAQEKKHAEAALEEAKKQKQAEVATAGQDGAAVTKDEDSSGPRKEKEKKDRKFCLLPPKDRDGRRDPLWERVFMVNVDEVGAHCGLFAAERPHYEMLVHDVGELVQRWVRESNNERESGASMARASQAM